MPRGTGSSGKTPGTELKKLIEEHGLSVRATALAMGETSMSLKAALDGKKKFTPDFALKLEKVFGKKADEWVQMQVACDFAAAKSNTSLQSKLAGIKKAGDIKSGRGPKKEAGAKKGTKAGAKTAAGAKRGPKAAAKTAKTTGAKRGPKPKTPAASEM
ncbi:MAG: HigA family addiction module antidote protein [Spirochaetaceae bacterium]|jgi:addiction module HigA family antidote|nr:HigA family addiction module antidote protein [Spirochaetaceae bacterium]